MDTPVAHRRQASCRDLRLEARAVRPFQARRCSPSATCMAAPMSCARSGAPSATWRRKAAGKRRLVYSRRHDQSRTRQRGACSSCGRPTRQRHGRRPHRPADGQPRDHDDAGRHRRSTCAQGGGACGSASAWGGQLLLDQMARPRAGAPGDSCRPGAPQKRPWARRSCIASTACARMSGWGNTLFRSWRARSARRSRRVPDPPPGRSSPRRAWAWINHGFLDWKGGFGGTLVVHGHTPPDKHKAISGMEDPHLFEGDRLGLDGGSARHRHRHRRRKSSTAATASSRLARRSRRRSPQARSKRAIFSARRVGIRSRRSS